MKIRSMLAASVVTAALLTSAGATAVHADYQTGHRIKGPTQASCQTSLNNAVNTYTRAGRVVTQVSSCVASRESNGTRVWIGAVFVRNY